MNQLIGGFLLETPAKIAEVRREVQALRELSSFEPAPARRHLRRIFQQIHTLKGSAAAFGLGTISALAHEIENLLEGLRREEIVWNLAALNALSAEIERIETALSTVRKKDVGALPHDLTAQIRGLTKRKNTRQIVENKLPAEFFDKLNHNEKQQLNQYLADGANVFAIAVEFPVGEFQTKLQTLRRELEQKGEIIAVLPGALAATVNIALQIIFAAQSAESAILKIIKSFQGTILFVYQNTAPITESLVTALYAGRRAASELEREVEFEILCGELKISKKQADALAVALLHLITNAVAHGIETPAERLANGKARRGIVKISARATAASTIVSVADDGRGIDFEKIIEKANEIFGIRFDLKQKDLAQARSLLFHPGFSTAKILTTISGRGVGLDAAQCAVETIGGTIEVASKPGQGAIFEVILPQG